MTIYMCKLAVSAKVLASFKTRKAFLWPLRLDSFGCEPDISDIRPKGYICYRPGPWEGGVYVGVGVDVDWK